jgi:serine O-acetyltransferase
MTCAWLEDIRRCSGKLSLKGAVHAFFDNYGLQALLGYRLGRWLLRTRARPWLWPVWPVGWPLYFLISRYVRVAFDIRLELSADIGPGFYIGHFGGIVLRRCQIGTHCSISQSVQIAPEAHSNSQGPRLGDRVWVGAHAKIIGTHQIGTGSTVSAGSVVKRDIPERTLCMGNPARVVMRDYDNSVILGVA